MNIYHCLSLSTESLRAIIFYSHIIPIIISLFLSGYTLFRTKANRLSIIFFAFSLSFSFWLIGDMFVWTPPNDYLVPFFWSWLDYLNIVFFVLGAYFFGVLSRTEISRNEKTIFILLLIPAFIINVFGLSITDFYQPACEILENDYLTIYKLFAEFVVVIMIAYSLIKSWGVSDKQKKIQLSVMAGALLLFFAIFSGTEYIATITDIYEINLYGLFILPLFLSVLVFSITNLKIFNLRYLGIQVLVYVLIIMVASQFLFLNSSTDRNLNIVTLFITLIFSDILLRNAKKEAENHLRIERLAFDLQKTNDQLTLLNRQKTEFVSFATHQLRSPLTSIKGYASLVLEGEVGHVDEKAHKAIETLFDSARLLEQVIDDYLNVSKIELGSMKYDLVPINFSTVLESVINQLKPYINKQKASFEFEIADEAKSNSIVSADREKMIQVLSNLIDNSFKYTPQGKVKVSLNTKDDRVVFEVSDTGIGMDSNTLKNIFAKYSRSEQASRQNSHGTGLGLFIAREIIKAHGGEINAYSEGEGKGSKFIVEIPLVKKAN